MPEGEDCGSKDNHVIIVPDPVALQRLMTNVWTTRTSRAGSALAVSCEKSQAGDNGRNTGEAWFLFPSQAIKSACVAEVGK